ncbi:hypothetical protein DD771_00740 [Helicobacter pylori]|nr:hypothetical protein DD771_00740 [Helicobacter pylori]
MKTSQSKKSNPKTKGSVLNASLVLKNFLKQKPNPPTQQTPQKKEKRNQQRENPLLERRKRLRS